MPTAISPQEFVEKWRHVTASESKMAQSHFVDLCHLVGHPAPLEIDPAGRWFTFEAGASKTGGGQGWADVWKRGYFGWEYKGKHADLTKAYSQLCQYREALENPPLLIVSDVDRIEIHTNFTNTPKRIVTLTLDDLFTAQGLDQLRNIFDNPEAFRSKQTTQNVTEDAAREFARLADLLRKYGEDAQRAAHFLIRILFCLFAEDIGLLPNKLFSRLVKSSLAHPESFPRRLEQLFAAMATGGAFGADDIKRFNGGLYNDSTALALDSEGMHILAGICDLDWSSIEPSILGTLFARSLDPSLRAKLGAQYTSKEDILLIVEPVVMAPLRRRWEEVKQQARDLAAKGTQKTKWHNALRDLIVGFASEIAKIQVLDPACGSGNFLYVALLLLLDLWKEVSVFGSELGLPMLLPDVNDSPSPLQMHGIETNSYAHDLAQTAVWIGYIQWRRDNGFGDPIEPILKPIETILHMDAILTHDEQGKPIDPEWPSADYAVGNPPFLGDKKMRAELGDKYVDDLRALYADRIPGQSDLVCYWFEKARAMVEAGKLKRAGLLTTQGIRGEANRTVLERIKQTGDIFWAQSDRDWILDGAKVHVSMVAFDRGDEKRKELDGKSVPVIHADLSSGADLTSAKHLLENEGLSFIGTQKSGPFDLTETQAKSMLAMKGNPNKRPNSDVVKPWINALDITDRPRNMWIIDFGTNMPVEEAAQYEKPFEYVKAHVKPLRDKVRRKNHRRLWWMFGESRPGMRKAITNLSRYIATPMVSRHKVFVWEPVHVIPENLIVVIARDDDYFLGVLHSKLHELWLRRKGTQLREAQSGTRYTPTTTFETFPFPWAPGKEPKSDPRVKAIAKAANELVQLRDNWLNPPDISESELKKRTLTNLYNARPSWLEIAHRRLDEAVLDAYGWPHDLRDDEILARLLELNLARAAKQENTGKK